MSFFTALTGLNAATAQLGVTSNNIANAGTIGFKRSRTDFGDIFATSPLQKATSTVGQGVSLKRVTQEFSQGNVSFSSNTLDLAITGDGFFPLKSADGFQDIYTRNGSFMMNDQYTVVNSAGQRLMAASVDSSGKANLSDLNVLTIPQKTTGQAMETTLVKLGLNFPADAQVISEPFNRNNPNTYNKSTALTVYDKGGNGYLATVYYVKTQNASASQPTNKWQTYVYIGDSMVSASLQQAANESGEKMYVNKYGQKKPESEVSDLLVNAKTKMFSLDDLTDVRTSVPASVAGISLSSLYTNADTKIDLSKMTDAQKISMNKFMTISVDGSTPVDIDMSYLYKNNMKLTGSEFAKELTNELNHKFGDERYFDLSTMSQPITLVYKPNAEGVGTDLNIDLSDIVAYSKANNVPLGDLVTDASKVTIDQLTAVMQNKINTAVTASIKPAGTANIKVQYDEYARGFKFVDSVGAATMGIRSNVTSNSIFGLTTSLELLDSTGGYSSLVGANGDFIRPISEQRYGLKVEFDNVKQNFTISSGTTGDASTIKVTVPSYKITGTVTSFAKTVATDLGTETTYYSSADYLTKVGSTTFFTDFSDLTKIDDTANEGYAKTLLGMSNTQEVVQKEDAIRGVASKPASIIGSPVQINVNNNFTVDSTNYKFVVAVDDVKGTVELPFGNTYTLDSFKAELEKRINQLANESGSTVSGVKVGFDRAKNAFTFTTGTATTNSFIKVSGSSTWGLANIDAGRGDTSTWIKPTQFTEIIDGVPVAKYIDEFGNETSSADGFKSLPEWSPIYLDKGELTFDTGGNLVSPKAGSQLDTVYLADGKGALTINIDYSKSTQFSSPYAVLSQSQDGAPEGDLVGVSIGDDGLVNASYSNGSQQSLGKVVLVNFSNPSGLRQIGDSSFYGSSASGKPKYGEAGSAGFGTVRSGATERANVDLTQELVDLITAQRNFQANAKAIETNTTLTQTIIQIRA
jgi:flagellar hook-basal body protein